METDVTGTHAVASLIDQSGFSKFTIQRPGAHRSSSPVFEFLRGSNTKQAVDAFKAWAHNVLSGGSNSNTYEIVLFDDIQDDYSDDLQDPEVSPKSKKKKSRTLRFTFSLSAFGSLPVVNGAPQTTSVEDAVRLALAERDKQDLAKKVQDLEQRLSELEQEEDEDEGDDVGSLGALQQIASLLGANRAAAPAPAINGEPEAAKIQLSKEQISNINRAISVLYKHDPDIDTDLLKLAGIAQSNPTQFNFLLNALRNM